MCCRLLNPAVFDLGVFLRAFFRLLDDAQSEQQDRPALLAMQTVNSGHLAVNGFLHGVRQPRPCASRETMRRSRANNRARTNPSALGKQAVNSGHFAVYLLCVVLSGTLTFARHERNVWISFSSCSSLDGSIFLRLTTALRPVASRRMEPL